MKNLIDASIIVISFNHEKYIQDCLVSIVSQKTNRIYEIIWFDDASEDQTVIKGKEILALYNINTTYLHSSNNKFTKKLSPLLELIENCSGEYIFILDGDDFWVDPKKIDLQIDALEVHKSINLCFTPAYTIENISYAPNSTINKYSDKPIIIPLDIVITGDGGLMPTASLCFRRSVFDNAPNWLFGYMPVGDYPMQVLGSKENGALFLPEITSCYRINQNSWSKTHYEDPINRLVFENEFLELLIKLDIAVPNQKEAFRKIYLTHFKILTDLAFSQGNYSLLLQGALTSLKLTRV